MDAAAVSGVSGVGPGRPRLHLTRAAGTLTGTFHAKATCATIRDRLINVPVRLARSARKLILHLPEHRPWQDAFDNLFATVHAPPEVA